jgi:hypothetical protein
MGKVIEYLREVLTDENGIFHEIGMPGTEEEALEMLLRSHRSQRETIHDAQDDERDKLIQQLKNDLETSRKRLYALEDDFDDMVSTSLKVIQKRNADIKELEHLLYGERT